jgi:hypothetical protein
VDGHHFEAMTAEVMEFGEEGQVGGAAVRRSEDGGAEDYFKAALDALDPVFNYVGGDSFEYAVVFVREQLLKSRVVCIGRVSRIGNCGRSCEWKMEATSKKKRLTAETARGRKWVRESGRRREIRDQTGSNSSGMYGFRNLGRTSLSGPRST